MLILCKHIFRQNYKNSEICDHIFLPLSLKVTPYCAAIDGFASKSLFKAFMACWKLTGNTPSFIIVKSTKQTSYNFNSLCKYHTGYVYYNSFLLK